MQRSASKAITIYSASSPFTQLGYDVATVESGSAAAGDRGPGKEKRA